MVRAAAYVYSHAYPSYDLPARLVCSILHRDRVRVIQNQQELVETLSALFESQVRMVENEKRIELN